ncbi:hypothetical protein BKA70DRAFT_1238736 [Coprinopsis sp. MPI-PUGE-AT-0042]|nr:hypothetical protein BKA70DRAFT_1238736 [Coprinopsis sp. MPI-PUGE-AT-0042]
MPQVGETVNEILRKGILLECTGSKDRSEVDEIMSAFDSSDSEDEREFQRVFRRPSVKRRVKDLSVNRGPTTGMVPASESDTCDNGAEVAPLAPAAASGLYTLLAPLLPRGMGPSNVGVSEAVAFKQPAIAGYGCEFESQGLSHTTTLVQVIRTICSIHRLCGERSQNFPREAVISCNRDSPNFLVSGINESPTQVNDVYPIVQAQLVRAMSTATSTDPLKGHSKPLCSQLIGDSVEAGIKSEELEGFLRNPLSVLAGAGTGAAPTANLPVDEENHITLPPHPILYSEGHQSQLCPVYSKAEVQPSISGWKVEREGFKPEEDEAGDLQALSFLDQAASSDTNLKEVPAPSLQQPAQSTVTSMASSDSEMVERQGWLAFVVFGIFRIGLTVLRVARYLAFKCFQFLALTCTIAMLIDMLKELRQQG